MKKYKFTFESLDGSILLTTNIFGVDIAHARVLFGLQFPGSKVVHYCRIGGF